MILSLRRYRSRRRNCSCDIVEEIIATTEEIGKVTETSKEVAVNPEEIVEKLKVRRLVI
jgi:hypothetical protein